SHIAVCATCRTRCNHVRGTLAELSDALRADSDPDPSSRDRSRAVLRARLAESSSKGSLGSCWRYLLVAGCAVIFVLILAMGILHPPTSKFFKAGGEAQLLPNPQLTPGTARSLTKTELCDQAGSSMSRFIPPATGRHIFDEYGISDPRPGGYELDYLI